VGGDLADQLRRPVGQRTLGDLQQQVELLGGADPERSELGRDRRVDD